MIFLKELSFSSFNDAYETYNKHYKPTKLEDFLKATLSGHCENYKIKDIIDNPPENLDTARLLAKTPAEAYPPNNRPRGADDINSVVYHMIGPAFFLSPNFSKSFFPSS